MKSCPTCNRTFEDSLTFCLIDGSVLSAPIDLHATLIIPQARQTEPPPTEVLQPQKEIKQEIPPIVASPEPEQKTGELTSTISAPAPAFESPRIKDSPVEAARKPKRWPPIIGVIAALIILAAIAAFYFSRREESRIDNFRLTSVWLAKDNKEITRIKPNDEIKVFVVVAPVAKVDDALKITRRLFSIGEPQSSMMDLLPRIDYPVTAQTTTFPLGTSLQLGKYKLEVVLHDSQKELDTKTVEFEVIEAGEISQSPTRSSLPNTPIVDNTRVFSPEEVDQKARILSKPEPTYTEEASKNKITGKVVLSALLTADGKVEHIEAISGLPYGLTQKAVDAVRQIKFTPAVKGGQPVSQFMRIEYTFNLY